VVKHLAYGPLPAVVVGDPGGPLVAPSLPHDGHVMAYAHPQAITKRLFPLRQSILNPLALMIRDVYFLLKRAFGRVHSRGINKGGRYGS
jgi:hypothetical protein